MQLFFFINTSGDFIQYTHTHIVEHILQDIYTTIYYLL